MPNEVASLCLCVFFPSRVQAPGQWWPYLPSTTWLVPDILLRTPLWSPPVTHRKPRKLCLSTGLQSGTVKSIFFGRREVLSPFRLMQPLHCGNPTNHRLVFAVCKPIPFVPQQLDRMVLGDHSVAPSSISRAWWRMLIVATTTWRLDLLPSCWSQKRRRRFGRCA
jgi:hypothetical protein